MVAHANASLPIMLAAWLIGPTPGLWLSLELGPDRPACRFLESYIRPPARVRLGPADGENGSLACRKFMDGRPREDAKLAEVP
jgi:hypothetical protein